MHKIPKSCKSKKQSLEQSNLQTLVDEYIGEDHDSYELEDQWWGDKNLTWEKAITRAWESRLSNGKMHSHQCRVSNNLSKGLDIALAKKKQPEDFNDFQSVYDWVKSIVDCVKGLGSVTAYDVARRLGAWLRLKPAVVYLQAGSAEGARKLGIKGEIALLSVFPVEIQLLEASHIENFLCIYKKQISCSVAPLNTSARHRV